MSQSDKAKYFRALKAAGVTFENHYREYNTKQLKAAYDKLVASGAVEPQPEPDPEPEPEPPPFEPLSPILDGPLPMPPGYDVNYPSGPGNEVPPLPADPTMPVGGFDPGAEVDPEAAAFFGFQMPDVPRQPKDPAEMAGQRQSKDEDEPIRIDPDTGRMWFQEEILKPAFPKPRARRVLQYMDEGVKQQTVSNGQYYESFEVAGDPTQARPAEVKITLPSYQVGIYRDPRFPFRVHCYNGLEGFDLFEVQEFYHGPELVPSGIKRIYVENVLCYDIRTTVRAIEDEYRHLQLTGKVQ